MGSKVLAHVESFATAVVAAFVGYGTTYLGQGTPDFQTQSTVGLVFGSFVWAAALWHRWRMSPALVLPDLATYAKQLEPLANILIDRYASSRAPSPPPPLPISIDPNPTPKEGANRVA